MPVRSAGEQPARPTPAAAAPPPSPVPEVPPPQTHPRQEAEVRDQVLNPSENERRSGLTVYEPLAATLRSQELPTAHSHPANSSTAPH